MCVLGDGCEDRRVRALPRPLLVTLAVLFATATVLYSAIWMYAVRWDTKVFLGVEYRHSASTRSSRITNVVEGSAAEQAGLAVDDQVVAVNGRSLGARHGFHDAVWRGQPGDAVTLTVERPGEPAPLTLEVTLGPAQALPGETRPLAQTILDQVTSAFPVPFVIVGLGVLFLRLEDRNAWLLALLFGGFVAVAPLLSVEADIPPALRGFGVAYKVTFFGLVGPLFYYFGSSYECVHDSGGGGPTTQRRKLRTWSWSCRDLTGERPWVDGRLRGPRSWWGACSAASDPTAKCSTERLYGPTGRGNCGHRPRLSPTIASPKDLDLGRRFIHGNRQTTLEKSAVAWTGLPRPNLLSDTRQFDNLPSPS